MRDLKHSTPGWIGTASALASLGLFVGSVWRSFCRGGEAGVYAGSLGLLALVLAAGAVALGILALREGRVRPLPPRVSLGLGLVLTLGLIGLYAYGF